MARVDGVAVSRCRSCGALHYPPRLVCHRCGGASWLQERARTAVVEETTAVRHAVGTDAGGPRYLATVIAEGGLRLIVGLDGPLAEGVPVVLTDVDGAPHARRSDA